MKNMIRATLAFLLTTQCNPAFAAGRLQNEDFKSASDLTSAGGTASQLLNDTKIWVSSVTPAQQLSTAISTGVIGGGAGGSKNYLSTYKGNTGNGNLEFGSTTGWSLGHVALTNGLPSGTPTFGSGAAGTLSIAATTTSPLAGSYSLSYVSSAATTAGDMVCSSAFALDSEDQAKVLTLKAYYQAFSGASNMNFSGTSSNSYGVAVYDVTNSAWLAAPGAFGMTQSSGAGYVTATTQTASNTASARVCIYNVSATAGAATLYLDDISYGPQTAPIGAVVTDWVAYTPTFTGYGTPTAVTFYSRRVGDSLQVHGTFTSGTSTSVQNYIGLGFNGASGNVVVDTSKIAPNAKVGDAGGSAATSTLFRFAILAPGSNLSSVQMSVQTSSQSITVASQNASTLAASGQTFQVDFMVPIVGWGGTVSLSSDSDTRVIDFYGSSTATTGFSATSLLIPYVASLDTASGWNSGTQTYTIQVTGTYGIVMETPVIPAGAANIICTIYQNGTAVKSTYLATSAANQDITSTCNYVGNFKAGDTVQAKIASSSGTVALAGSTVGVQASLSISRRSGPAVVQAVESVNARYVSSTSSVSSSYSTAVFSSKDYDSHGAYNQTNGVYTVPISGKYLITSKLLITATTTHQPSMQITKNGTGVSQNYGPIGYSAGAGYDTAVSDQLNLLAGDQIAIQSLDSGTSPSLGCTATRCVFSIQRIGN